ncbi:MAG: hypothetical protein A3F40_01615 [Chlamydiae bacterium RIFCSPHIGHO2_12_FULL_27_8]|nr:MAG: hypothetical protein A3F40_01615 [Chlamydiae bacterium RIFCSPHIGHO2_12_FULL_27_8]OGN66138.1 MAG: hypothetical protein A2888_02565 [Chlamydiae bacterium RIFCSPLOWO2_01_FULL_28_7]
MDAIILAGGKGTRLQEVISSVPKPLAPINGSPFLDLLIKQLCNTKKINKIILSVGYKKDLIIKRYKTLKNVIFSEENTPLGTGGAVKKSLEKASTENVLILNGDTFQHFDLEQLFNFHINKNADCTIVCRIENDTKRYGTILLDSNNKITSFKEKIHSKNSYINSGIYVLKKNIFQNFEKTIFSIEEDFFKEIIKTKNIFGFQSFEKFIDIGTKESYFQAKAILHNLILD